MPLTTYAQNILLDYILNGVTGTAPASHYIALFTGNPVDDATTEVSAGEYDRQSVTFTASIAGKATNDADVSFGTTANDWGALTYYGIYTAASGGNLLAYGSFETVVEPDVGTEVKILAGQIEAQWE